MIYPVIGNCEDLYYKEHGCKIDVKSGSVYFKKVGSHIDYSTYFNMFSYGKWSKYTNCGSIGIRLMLKGAISLTISGITQSKGQAKGIKIRDVVLESAEIQECIVPIDATQSYDFYSVLITSNEDNSVVSDVAFVSMQDEVIANDISLGICICTFKREDEILENIKYIEDSIINNPTSLLYNKVKVFVSDNGSTLSERADEYIHIFHNKNYGGSGGFTRAIIESMKSDVTHQLLMDDDISFEIGVLERTYIFLRILKQEYGRAFLGAGMLIRDKQYMQHAAGETDDLVGIHFDKRDYDLRDINNVVNNERDMGSNYLGWWYVAIPREAVEENGYSYPMFVQYDDIEFSVRNSHSAKINVNGIGVWHDDFEQKRSMVKVYYTIRNRLISHSLCCSEFLLVRRWAECVLKSFGRMRRGYYFEAMLVLMAGWDYLKGPEYIATLDMEQKNTELYVYARRNDAPGMLVGWSELVFQWIKLFVMLFIKRKSVIKRYRDTAKQYTSKEYWLEKLELSE